MLKFSIPGQPQPIEPTPVLKQNKKSFEFDSEEPLPWNINTCDEIIDKLIEIGDVKNYQIVAKHVNDLVGFRRYEVSAPPKNISISRPVIIGDRTPQILEMWGNKIKIGVIIRASGLSGSKVRKILKDNNVWNNSL